MASAFQKSRKEINKMSGFQKLLDYYKECFSLIDTFHFNSRVTRDTYLSYILPISSIVIPITHNGIRDHRMKKKFNESSLLRIGFVGSTAPYKGLPKLIDALESLDMNSKWRLDVWGGFIGKEECLPVYYRGKFDQRAIEMVYTTMDIMVVPSLWHETFSLVTLEALSYGVPVLVSDNVGAKDIVAQYNSMFVYNSQEELITLLRKLIEDRTLLREYNNKILDMPWNHGMKEHAQEIIDKVYNEHKK